MAKDAYAPYNFIELPPGILPAQELPPHNSYDPQRRTGYFDVKLTALTPLFIRGMADAKKYKKGSKDNPKNEHFFMPDGKMPVIPGSSLRGMIRNLYEIITFSRMHFVSDANKIFFRAVAAKADDPLGEAYRSVFGRPNLKTHAGQAVRAGWLAREGNSWSIVPAAFIRDDVPFALVSDKDEVVRGVHNIKHLTDPNYKVTSFDVVYEMDTGKYAHKVRRAYTPEDGSEATGILVCTGNMAETQKKGEQKIRTNRKNFVVISKEIGGKKIPIPDHVVRAYLDALTPFQQEKESSHFDARYGILKEGRPVFFLLNPDSGQKEILHFGHTPNFRVAHLQREGRADGSVIQRAVTPMDRVPQTLRDQSQLDFTDAVFGYVHEDTEEARAGRVSITSAMLTSQLDNVSHDTLVQRVPGAPKPTTIQHYLEQLDKNGNPLPKPQLNHYGKNEAKIRGHKLYWRQRATLEMLVQDNAKDAKDDVRADMYPVTSKTRNQVLQFQFRVYFENLSDAELGALAWVLSLDGRADACHMIGMGKPYGMGIVKLEPTLHLSVRRERYTQLFRGRGWQTGYEEAIVNDETNRPITMQGSIDVFKQTVQDKFKLAFDDHPRIKELVTMLSIREPHSQFKYMQIEGANGNEYKDRPVLPRPNVVLRNQRK